MKTALKKTQRAGRMVAVGAAMVSAGLLLAALGGMAREAEATFPGANGLIAFASDRTTGEGIDNPEGDLEIFTMYRDGTGLKQLTENAALDFDPEWSPDGERIAFQSDRTFFSDIFVMNADGTGQTNVTNNRAFDRSATFSPDGERIAFDSNLDAGKGVDNPEGDFEIFAVGVDGAGLTQLTKNAESDFQPDLSPDGKRIAFVSRRNFAPGIYTMNSDGTKQKKVSRGPAVVFQSPSYAPDGERIAFVSDQNGPLNIYTMRADGRGQVRLTDNGVPTIGGPVFSPSGKRIAFHTNRDGNFEIHKMRADGTGPVNLTDDPAGDFTPDWQPVEERH
jgi:TolB protein